MAFSAVTRQAHNSSSGGVAGFLFRVTFRFFQFILAIVVAGLYGQDLHSANSHHKYADSKWVYAEVVAGLSAITTIIYGIPFLKSWMFFLWDTILFIMWVALFGIFAKMFLNEDPEGDSGVERMKHAVYVDLVNMLLWFITAVYGGIVFFRNRNNNTLHTGRAEV